MWVARNKDKRLWCALNKPIRTSKLSYGDTNTELCQWDFFHENTKDYGTDEMALELPISWFPDLKWEDEPIEVTLVPTISDRWMNSSPFACHVCSNAYCLGELANGVEPTCKHAKERFKHLK